MSLNEIQKDFLGFLLDQSNAIAGVVAEGGRIGIDARLHIYHHAYRARLIEVMQDVFERTWAYLGDEHFAQCARDYLGAWPPSARTLNRFGAAFPYWLAIQYPQDREIAEIALIDWLMRVAFDGPDARPLMKAEMAALTPQAWITARFCFHPTIELAPLTHNAASIWEAMEHGAPPPPVAGLAQRAWLLVWRKDQRPHFITIGEVEARAIEMLHSGTNFSDTCEALARDFPDDDIAKVTGLALRRWIEEELLVDIVEGEKNE